MSPLHHHHRASQVRVLRRGEMLRLLLARCPEGPHAMPDGTPARTVGLVGYPNVGKSSTVNAMVAAKKVHRIYILYIYMCKCIGGAGGVP